MQPSVRAVVMIVGLGIAAGCGGAAPAADCARVGDRAASFELGNYAPPEARAPVIARLVARCREVRVSVAQGACLAGAKNRWAAATCAPALFPDVDLGGDCAAVADRFAAAVAGTAGPTPSGQDLPARLRETVLAACQEDGWPPPLKACLLAADDLTRGRPCGEHLTDDLEAALAKRIRAAM